MLKDCQYVAGLLLLIWLVPAETAQSAPDRATAIAQLSENEKRTAVVAILKEREATLQNFSYHATDSTNTLEKASNSRTFLHKDDYEVRRLGTELWIRVRNYKHKSLDEIRADGIASWDGRTARSVAFPPYLGSTFAQCRIDIRENSNFGYYVCNLFTGLRMPAVDDEPSRSPSEWFQSAIDSASQVSISRGTTTEGDILRLQVTRNYEVQSLDLDCARQYMPVLYSFEYHAGGYNRMTMKVLQSKLISGIWMPTDVLRLSGTSAVEGKQTEIRTQITQFQVGSVTPADVHIDFPANAQVVDLGRKIAYIVQPDGRLKLLDLLDPGTNTFRRAPDQRVVSQITPAVVSSYSAEASPQLQLPGTIRGTARSQTSALVWTGIGIATLVLGAFVAWTRRARLS